MGNPVDPDNLARALSRYVSTAAGVDQQSGNDTDQRNTSELPSWNAGLSVVPLTRLSIGELN